ncbi:hypothetical protein DSCW_05500 [Desulfosarcina widdelii]|uniref:CopG family transcriptional regulator n=1 Tax=Desulfosarcina widdelii TaxID=947919 RepID=A0A5K7YYX7_9BACT|nr:hypothetical protein [Desulfosarcina widdelii]BBO73133.1 hypothetical protein DSCW_05500 [Desulfosarcina widdelii]
MARRKSYETPSSGRVAITLDKRQFKEVKKISIEFELPESEVFQLAVNLLIERFNALSTEVLDEKGKDALFE